MWSIYLINAIGGCRRCEANKKSFKPRKFETFRYNCGDKIRTLDINFLVHGHWPKSLRNLLNSFGAEY